MEETRHSYSLWDTYGRLKLTRDGDNWTLHGTVDTPHGVVSAESSKEQSATSGILWTRLEIILDGRKHCLSRYGWATSSEMGLARLARRFANEVAGGWP